MTLSDRQLLDSLSRTPFVDSKEFALILGEPHATVHRALTDLLTEGIVMRFDATITLHGGRSFGVVRQGLALRHRSLYDRLRAIAEYDPTQRPGAVLVLVPSGWEQRLTGEFRCKKRS